MIRVCACPDSFKGTQTSVDVCRRIASGLAIAESASAPGGPRFSVDHCPMSDGGMGFLAAAAAALAGSIQLRSVSVTHPYAGADGRTRHVASFGVSAAAAGGDHLVVIETAEACGINLAPADKALMDPRDASTYGVGELIAAATAGDGAAAGARTVMVGLGGTCTNDCGVGLLQALGARFFCRSSAASSSSDETEIVDPICARTLTQLTRCDLSALRVAPRTRFVLVSDVTNPLLGPTGATAVYGPQKGATTAERRDELERGVANAARLLVAAGAQPFQDQPGAGAAGGMCGALLACIPHGAAVIRPGAETFAEMAQLERRIACADVVVSGEGSFDSQTIEFGKTVAFVASLCRKHGKPLVVVCGVCDRAAAQAAADMAPPVAVVAVADLVGAAESLARPGETLELAVAQRVSAIVAAWAASRPVW